MIKRKFRYLSIIAMFLFLAGCATTTVQQTDDISLLGESEGIVFGVINTEYHLEEDKLSGDDLPKLQHKIYYSTPDNIAAKYIFSVSDFSTVIEGNASDEPMLFVLRLSEGNYTFYKTELYFGRISIPVDYAFTVTPGKATYIDTFNIVYYGATGLFGETITSRGSISRVSQKNVAIDLFRAHYQGQVLPPIINNEE